MKNERRHNQISPDHGRSGFTLLELLMVVAIIGLLMSLSFVAMFGLTDQAKEEATTTTIRKVDALLQQRIAAFDRAFKGNRKNAAVNTMSTLLASQNIHGVRNEVKEILAKKAAFRFEFPQRLVERLQFDPDSNVTGMPDSIFQAIAAPNARQKLINEGNPTPTEAEVLARVTSDWARRRPETESSALLYFTLTASGSFGVSSVDSDRFTNDEVADTDGDGLPEFIDAWGQPLRFYRWPTRIIDVNPPVPFQPDLFNLSDPTDTRAVVGAERERANLLFKGLAPPPSMLPNGALPRDLLLTDPDDPVGRLYAELERLNGLDGKPLLAVEYNEANYHTPETFHTPLVVSAGPDLTLGLFEPTDTANAGNLAAYNSASADALLDNITNRNRRSGGRR